MIKTIHTLTASYSLHGHTLTNTETTTYLGITIQQNLEWEKHIQTISNRLTGQRNLFESSSATSKYTTKNLKNQAYKTLVRPLLEYAAAVCDPHQKEEIDRLEKTQRRAARWVKNRYRRTSSVNNILQDLAWPTLQ